MKGDFSVIWAFFLFCICSILIFFDFGFFASEFLAFILI